MSTIGELYAELQKGLDSHLETVIKKIRDDLQKRETCSCCGQKKPMINMG